MRSVCTTAGVAALLAGVFPALSLAAPLQQASGRVDLLNGAQGSRAAPVWAVGDVDDDGRADVVTRLSTGTLKVIFSQSTGPNLTDPSAAPGFEISNAGSQLEVASAGDVNGDGKGDLLVGSAYAATPVSPDDASGGSVFVVFGATGGRSVDVSSDGLWGYRIDGHRFQHLQNYTDFFGERIAPAGDVNADGTPDALITAEPSSLAPGTAYVVFGQRSSRERVSVASLGSHGYRITTGQSGASFPLLSRNAVGDVNADGVDDIVLRETGTNRIDVIFGRAGGQSDVNPDALGTRGYRVLGEPDNEIVGVGALGDVNGDGKADFVAFGSKQVFPSNPTGSWVLFGKSASTNDLALPANAARGYKLFDYFGDSFAVVDDFAGSGKPMLAFGDMAGSPAGYTNDDGDPIDRSGAGVIAVRDLQGLSRDPAVVIDGAFAGDHAGYDVAAAGDLNGDGHPDLIVGSREATLSHAVLFGFARTTLSYSTSNLTIGLGTVVRLIPTTRKPTGIPTYSVSPALPAGLTLDPRSGVISGTPSLATTGTYTVTVSDLAGEARFALTIGIIGLSGSASSDASDGPSGAASPGAPGPQGPGSASAKLALRRPASVIRVTGRRIVVPCRLARGVATSCKVEIYVGARRVARGRGLRSVSIGAGRSLRTLVRRAGKSGLKVRVVVTATKGSQSVSGSYIVRLRLR